MFPVSECFRLLVGGSAYQRIAELIEEKIRCRTTRCDSDVAAIVVGREDAAATVAARDTRGFCMPALITHDKTGSQSAQG
nr:hypothetical protein [uncultured Dongia sp.]